MSKKPMQSKRGSTHHVEVEESKTNIALPKWDSMKNGLILADELLKGLMATVDAKITDLECMKKIPDYNSSLAVDQAISVLNSKLFAADPRKDDCYLPFVDEPVSTLRSY